MKWDTLYRQKFVIEKQKVTYATAPEVLRLFKELNDLCFDGFLSEPNIIVKSFRKRERLWGTYDEVLGPTITIEKKLRGWHLVETVFHEMIHQFQHEAGWFNPNDHHGSLFHEDYDKRIKKVKMAYEPRTRVLWMPIFRFPNDVEEWP